MKLHKDFIPINLVVSFCIFLAACNDPTTIGNDLLTNVESLEITTTDTLSLAVNANAIDSVLTGIRLNNNYKPALLGTIADDIFGQSTASIYTQVRLAAADNDLGTNISLDSIVLSLEYDEETLFGDVDALTNVQIYRVTEDMPSNQLFYSTEHFSYEAVPVGQKTNFRHNVVDSLTLLDFTTATEDEEITTFKVAPQLRIRLNDELGYEILAQSNTTNLSGSVNFNRFFKGLYITSSQTENVLARFNLLATQSRLTVYYSSSNGKGLLLPLQITSSEATVNHFTHHLFGSRLDSVVQATQPNSQEKAYLASMANQQVTIDIPQLKSLDSNISINKAVLEVTLLAETDTTAYGIPPQLSFASFNVETNTRTTISTEPPVQIAGNFGETLYRYNILITIYLQRKLKGELDDRVEKLFITNDAIHAYRAIIGGPNHPDYPMKLKLVITSLEN